MQDEYRELLKHVETVGIVNPDGSIDLPCETPIWELMGCLAPFEEIERDPADNIDGRLPPTTWRQYKPRPGTTAYHADQCQTLSKKVHRSGAEWRRFPPEAIRHLRLAAGVEGVEPNNATRKPLTPKEEAVLAVIREHGPITGGEIIAKLAKLDPKIPMDQSTLTSRVIPNLRAYDVTNDGRGYYVNST